MIHPIVLDACTIINLLRIDEEDEFLSKKIKDLDLHIEKVVYYEVQKNIHKIRLSDEQSKYISEQLPSFISYTTKIETNIYNQLKKDFFEELCSFSNHTKKENGELTSTLLALYLSRKNQTRLYFYTDDLPAKDQFSPYFSFQQIGVIGDSVDLLLFLYTYFHDFKKEKLNKYLHNLYSEYNIKLKLFFNEIVSNKNDWTSQNSRDLKLRDNLNKIEQGYLHLNFDIMKSGIDYFKDRKKSYPHINEIINKYPEIKNESVLTLKIKNTLENLLSYKICHCKNLDKYT